MANREDLEADSAIGPVNLFPHSLFSHVTGHFVDNRLDQHPSYRAILETLFSYGSDAKTSQLTSALFYKDTADNMDLVNFNYDLGV